MAAGNSSRMGQCKFLLKLPNGKTFLENILSQTEIFPFRKTIIVTQSRHLLSLQKLFSEKFPPGLKFVFNDFPEQERFYSLQLGIKAAANADFCFVHNADNPFISKETLHLLYQNRKRADYICPRFANRGGHPILLNKQTLSYILDCPQDSKLNDVLTQKLRLNIEMADDSICVDIDTPEEYQEQLRKEMQLI